jgi:hypothetical protein
MPQQDNTVLMEGVRIIFRNFRGEEGLYNKEGTRTFGVILDEKTAQAMANDGWPVKHLEARPEFEEEGDTPWLPVACRFDVFPPRIVIVTSRGREQIEERQVEMLDWADITNVDLIVRPHFWEVSGKSGIKAYVKTMYVTIMEDALELKYGALGNQGDAE